MSFLATSEAVVVDLRANGGSPTTVALVCSYFFNQPTHLNVIYTRATDSTRQFWTQPHVVVKALAGKDVSAMTSRRTYSGSRSSPTTCRPGNGRRSKEIHSLENKQSADDGAN